MKDKRNYLKVACFLETMYIIIMFIYYLFVVGSKSETTANIFLLLISTIFTVILYNESKKDISYLKNNNIKILISSIWMFLESIIPGILCFFFLSSIKEKKQVVLPEIKQEKVSKKEKIKSIITVISFLVILFGLPNFSFLKNISSYFIYAFILILVIVLYHKDLINNLKVFLKNFKTYLPFIIKRYFTMLGIMLIVAVPIVLINSGKVSGNQQAINEMFEKVPVATLLLSCLYAPLAEESIFRLSLSKLFTNKNVFVIVSGFLFGALHVINNVSSAYDLLYIFQYAILGMCLAKAYKDSDNIFVSISMHFIQNFLAAILVLLLY